MSFELSVDLPKSLTELVTSDAFENFTIGGPNHEVETTLAGLSPHDLFEVEVRDEEMAACCHSGLWLLHNFLDASHEISQDIHSREGSYWHGIMHRLEGDFGNSKYWYRNVGPHPIFESMLEDQVFDPYDFVDQCQSAHRDDSKKDAVRRIAAAEWRSLFEYCYVNAIDA